MRSKSSFDLPHSLRDGDLVFIAIDSFLYRRVASATRGWTSHVGIVFRDGSEWTVYESTIPKARITPINDFLERAASGQYSIQRFERPLIPDEIAQLRTAATRRLGKRYHLGFDYDSQREYCSKYVYDVFRDALGLEVGTLETMADLIEANPEESRTFWKWWFLGRIPLGRRLVTPQSQLDDPAWFAVLSSDAAT